VIRRDGDAPLYRVTCDWPGCTAGLDVIAEWSQPAKAEARRRGWSTHCSDGGALVLRQLCPAHKETP
jgi:hypothetical protein